MIPQRYKSVSAAILYTQPITSGNIHNAISKCFSRYISGRVLKSGSANAPESYIDCFGAPTTAVAHGAVKIYLYLTTYSVPCRDSFTNACQRYFTVTITIWRIRTLRISLCLSTSPTTV